VPTLVVLVVKCNKVKQSMRDTKNRYNARFVGVQELNAPRGMISLTRLPIKPVIGKKYQLTLEEI
jgi:hypothetical protein